MKTGVIYIIKNKINDKVYIGQTTTDIHTRFTQHCKRCVVANRHYKIYNAIKKYGKENFWIEELERDIPIDKLNQKEIEYITKYNSFEKGYNSTKGGDGRTINKHYDEENIIKLYTQDKLSSSQIAKIYNVSYATITRVLHRKSVKVRHDGNKYEDLKDNFIVLWNSGATYKEIAKLLNTNERTVGRYVKRFGLKPRGKGSKLKRF